MRRAFPALLNGDRPDLPNRNPVARLPLISGNTRQEQPCGVITNRLGNMPQLLTDFLANVFRKLVGDSEKFPQPFDPYRRAAGYEVAQANPVEVAGCSRATTSPTSLRSPVKPL